MISCRNILLEDNLDWDKLTERSKTATFFQTREWLSLWLKHFPGESQTLGIYENEDLIGVAPLYIRENKVNFLGVSDVLGDNSLSDFGDIIAVAGREKEVWEMVLGVILGTTQSEAWRRTPESMIRKDSGQARMTKVVEFNFIREESPSLGILKELGGNVERIEVSPFIDLPKTWDDYLLSLDRHDRHELRRKIRKGQGEGIELMEFTGIDAEIDLFLKLMAESNEQKRDCLTDEMKMFFKDMINSLWEKKILSLTFLKLQQKAIAAAVTFLFKNEVLLYNSGFDPAFYHLSPGLILKSTLIKRAIESGKKRFDFLRGGERYKYDLGGMKRNLYKISFTN